MKHSPLQRKSEMVRGQALARRQGIERKTQAKRKGAISTAAKAQRAKAREMGCLVTGDDSTQAMVDPAHLTPRGRGGCASALCVVGLRRDIHREFDEGRFDLLPYLLERRQAQVQDQSGRAVAARAWVLGGRNR